MRVSVNSTHKIRQFNMLVVLLPIFVADIKIIFGYNFAALLKTLISQTFIACPNEI